MKQLYVTSEAATKNGPTPESRVRAASPGLAPERLAAVRRYAGYASPSREVLGEAAAPVRLALLTTPDAGRFVCHSTCLGIDPATGKNGHYFSHLLLDVPPTLDAQQAIQSWGSRLWQRGDHGGGSELPEALYLPVSSTLGDAELKEFLKPPANRDLLQFLLAAYLTAKPEGRLFVAAPAETVALCVYGLTRALPPSLLADLTFSTYEHDVLAGPARLAGTCGALPAACFEPPHAAYDTTTGRRTEPAGAVPFAEFAVAALAKGQPAALDEFHATWQRLGVKEAGLFELVYRLARGTGVLTKEESEQVFYHPTLGAWVAVRPDAVALFLEWALEDQAYATTTFSRAVAALRQKPDQLAKLAETVRARGVAALRDGDLTRARNALEVLMPMVAPARAARVWGELLEAIADPETLSWEMRGYFLPHLARLKPLQPGETPDAATERWLRVPAERLAWLLALDLPQTYPLAACLAALRSEGELSSDVARTMAKYPALVLAALHRLPAEGEGLDRALGLFQSVLTEAPDHPWAEDVVRAAKTLPPALLDRCLTHALEKNAVALRPLVREHGPALRELLADKPSLDRIASQLLDQPADDLLTDRGLGDFLQSLTEGSCLRPEVRTRLDACLTMRAFLAGAALERHALDRVAAALSLEPPLFPETVRGRVLAATVATWRQRTGEGVQNDLETLLLALGPAWQGGAAGLYRELLHTRQDDRALGKRADLLHALLAVALGAAQSMELAGQLDGLDAEAYGLAQRIARQGGARVLKAIDARTATWPRSAKSQWSFLAKAVRPRGARGLLRDVGLVAAGVLLGAGGMLVAQWLRVF